MVCTVLKRLVVMCVCVWSEDRDCPPGPGLVHELAFDN